MEIKEIIDVLRVCADDEIICPACPRYDKSLHGGSAACFSELMFEAADTIESQQKRIAELEAALREQEERRWIPVTERLPEPWKEVITNRTGGHLSIEFKCAGDGWSFENDIMEEVTHWMPLPEPPKE